MRNLTLASVLLLAPLLILAQTQDSSPAIKVRHLTLNGLTGISEADQVQIARDIKSQTYTDDTIDEIPARLRTALMQRGFFRANAPAPEVRVVNTHPGEEVIDMTYHVQEGPQYHLKRIAFSSNRPSRGFVFPEQELRQTFPISDGAVFDSESIRDGVQKLRELYASKGYVNCIPVPNIQTDDPAATVTVNIDLDEGAVYRVGALVLDGVEPFRGAGAKFLESWKQYQGQVYDGKLAASFMRANAAYLSPKALIFAISEDGAQHLLNFRLSFDGPARQ